MYIIKTTNNEFFYTEHDKAATVMYVLEREGVKADMYKVIPEIGKLLVWHIG